MNPRMQHYSTFCTLITKSVVVLLQNESPNATLQHFLCWVFNEDKPRVMERCTLHKNERKIMWRRPVWPHSARIVPAQCPHSGGPDLPAEGFFVKKAYINKMFISIQPYSILEQHYNTFLHQGTKSAVVLHPGIQFVATLQHFFASRSKKCCSVAFGDSIWSNTTTFFCVEVQKVLQCCIRGFNLQQHYSIFLRRGPKSAVVLHQGTHFGATLQHFCNIQGLFWKNMKKQIP